jgi:hypothetical protein
VVGEVEMALSRGFHASGETGAQEHMRDLS